MQLRPRCNNPTTWGPCDIHKHHPGPCATTNGQPVGKPAGNPTTLKQNQEPT